MKSIILLILFYACVNAQTPQYLLVSGITNPAEANGIYVKQIGTTGSGYSPDWEYWKHQSAGYYIYADVFSGEYFWNIDNNLIDNDPVYFVSDGSHDSGFLTTLTSPDLVWNWVPIDGTEVFDDGSGTGGCQVDIYTPSITFTDGNSFTQSITPGSSNQVLGRFQLTGSLSGATLTAASIQLNNARTGLSNLTLWSSTDAAFGSDTQLGSPLADPGNGNSVTYSSLSSSISTSGTYYFLTGDISTSPTGTVQGVIVQNSSFTISGGTLSGTITNAVLSSNTAALPVELVSFSGTASRDAVLLNWVTATEMNNYGFEIERSQNDAWQKIGFVQGHGNSNSPKEYTFIDENPLAGNIQYRLKQIDNDGHYEYYSTIEEVNYSITSVEEEQLPTEFALEQNYPNPFNPTTKISYSIPNSENVLLKVYDVLGKEVKTLVNGYKNSGTYEIEFNASELPSGLYLYKITAGNYSETRKMILMR